MQLALGDVLQVFVNRQLEGRSGCRRALEAAEGLVPRVRLNQDGAGLAPNLRVVGVFDAAQPLVVDSDPAEQVRRELLVRVEPLAFLDGADAVEMEIGDAPRLIGGDLAP